MQWWTSTFNFRSVHTKFWYLVYSWRQADSTWVCGWELFSLMRSPSEGNLCLSILWRFSHHCITNLQNSKEILCFIYELFCMCSKWPERKNIGKTRVYLFFSICQTFQFILSLLPRALHRLTGMTLFWRILTGLHLLGWVPQGNATADWLSAWVYYQLLEQDSVVFQHL